MLGGANGRRVAMSSSTVSGFASAILGLLALNALVDFFAMHRHRFGRGDAHSNLAALYAENGDRDVLSDFDRFADSSS